VEWYEWR